MLLNIGTHYLKKNIVFCLGHFKTRSRGNIMRKLNKKETIKNIMQLLDNGKTICINGGKLWEIQDRGKTYIKWCHFGSSANKRTLEELTWVINTIFECKNKPVVYSCN